MTMGIVAVLASVALATQPTGTAALQPTSKWNVDFGDAHCIAMRNYRTEAAPLMLAFKPSPVGDVMQVSVVRPGGKTGADQYPGTLTIGAGAPVQISVLGYHAASGKNRVASVNLRMEQFAPLRTASAVRLRSAQEIDATFALTNMAPVTHALDRCVTGLRERWNLGEPHAGSVRDLPHPIVALGSQFTSDDYPHVALIKDAGGSVAMTMLIDERGKVASCMVTATSGYASLDAQSCSIMVLRAKFAPAVGKDGKPIKSGITQVVKWMVDR